MKFLSRQQLFSLGLMLTGLALCLFLYANFHLHDIYLFHQILTGAENFTMPDDLDPTTARLVSELSAMILPSLSKSLASAIPSVDFAGAAERINRTAQDLRSEIVKALRSEIDDSRAGRSMIMQSIGNVLEEISSLRKSLDRLPEILQSAVSTKPQENITYDNEPVMTELDEMSKRIDTLTQGIKAFFETYAQNHENEAANIPEILRPSIDSEALAGIEGLIKAESKSHSTALSELSREISAMIEENNTALIHEVREAAQEEISGALGGEHESSKSRGGYDSKLLKITALLSGSCAVLLVINIILSLLR